MKQNEISLNSLLIDSDRFLLTDEEIGDNHVATSIDTPIREDAFDLSDLEKIKIIEGHFREIMLCSRRPVSYGVCGMHGCGPQVRINTMHAANVSLFSFD